MTPYVLCVHLWYTRAHSVHCQLKPPFNLFLCKKKRNGRNRESGQKYRQLNSKRMNYYSALILRPNQCDLNIHSAGTWSRSSGRAEGAGFGLIFTPASIFTTLFFPLLHAFVPTSHYDLISLIPPPLSCLTVPGIKCNSQCLHDAALCPSPGPRACRSIAGNNLNRSLCSHSQYFRSSSSFITSIH